MPDRIDDILKRLDFLEKTVWQHFKWMIQVLLREKTTLTNPEAEDAELFTKYMEEKGYHWNGGDAGTPSDSNVER